MSIKKISLLFTGQTNKQLSSNDVLHKCKRIAEDYEVIDHVFFYFDVVNIVKETQCYEQWQAFKEQHKLALIACSTVATRRNIENIATGPFELAGLSEFYSRLHSCHKLVQIQ